MTSYARWPRTSAYWNRNMNELMHWLDRRLPRRLTTRLTLAVIVVVIAAGLVTAGANRYVLAHNLEAEMIASGRTLTMALGESVANALVEEDLATIQETLDAAVHNNGEVVYAYAYGPHTPIVHTFPRGFPADLLHTLNPTGKEAQQGRLLMTEVGLVRDFSYRPLDGFRAEVHLGISQDRIAATQRQVTQFILMLTAIGCVLAATVTYGFSRMAIYPLSELTRRVRRLGRGLLDERIDLPPGDEVGDLAAAFNQMAAEIQGAIQQLQSSEAGYRDLLAAASTVGEGIALICDEGEVEGTFLFVNETFSRLAGFEPAELIGMNAASVLHPHSLALASETWQRVRTGQVRSEPTEILLTDRQGHIHVLETTGTLVNYQGMRALAWFTRDISERKAREEELRLRYQELHALNTLSAALSEPLTPDDLLRRALQQALAALGLDVGWVLVLNTDGSTRIAAQQGLDAVQATAFPECLCGAVLTHSQMLVIDATDHRCLVHQALSGQSHLTCHAAVPIQSRSKTLGILSVAAEKKQVFDDAEMRLLAAIGQQIGVALENARLWERLQQRQQMRGALLKQIMEAQEEERQRIARELHDGIGQSLNALVFGLNTVDTALDQTPEQAPTLVQRLRVSASDTVKELQDIIYDLRPSLLDDLGLVRALHWYAEDRLVSRGIHVTFGMLDDHQRLPKAVETALFRIGQETITNICKHAQARHVQVALHRHGDRITLAIRDDGVGLEVEQALSATERGSGWGLLGMQERATLLGGQLTIESIPGQGTWLRATLPLSQGEAS